MFLARDPNSNLNFLISCKASQFAVEVGDVARGVGSMAIRGYDKALRFCTEIKSCALL